MGELCLHEIYQHNLNIRDYLNLPIYLGITAQKLFWAISACADKEYYF